MMSGILLIPVRLVRLPLHLLHLVVRGVTPGGRRCRFSLPVSGLDEAKSQSIYFALQRASSSEEVRIDQFSISTQIITIVVMMNRMDSAEEALDVVLTI